MTIELFEKSDPWRRLGRCNHSHKNDCLTVDLNIAHFVKDILGTQRCHIMGDFKDQQKCQLRAWSNELLPTISLRAFPYILSQPKFLILTLYSTPHLLWFFLLIKRGKKDGFWIGSARIILTSEESDWAQWQLTAILQDEYQVPGKGLSIAVI